MKREFALLSADFSLAARLQTMLRHEGVHLVWCASVRDVRDQIEEQPPAALVVDMPRRSGRMLREVRRLARQVPVVVLTRDDTVTWRCLEVGAVGAHPRWGHRQLVDQLRDYMGRAASTG